MVNFGLLATEIDPVVWGTPANYGRPIWNRADHYIFMLLFYGRPIE